MTFNRDIRARVPAINTAVHLFRPVTCWHHVFATFRKMSRGTRYARPNPQVTVDRLLRIKKNNVSRSSGFRRQPIVLSVAVLKDRVDPGDGV